MCGVRSVVTSDLQVQIKIAIENFLLSKLPYVTGPYRSDGSIIGLLGINNVVGLLDAPIDNKKFSIAIFICTCKSLVTTLLIYIS
jgi:hypothetical protein